MYDSDPRFTRRACAGAQVAVTSASHFRAGSIIDKGRAGAACCLIVVSGHHVRYSCAVPAYLAHHTSI